MRPLLRFMLATLTAVALSGCGALSCMLAVGGLVAAAGALADAGKSTDRPTGSTFDYDSPSGSSPAGAGPTPGSAKAGSAAATQQAQTWAQRCASGGQAPCYCAAAWLQKAYGNDSAATAEAAKARALGTDCGL